MRQEWKDYRSSILRSLKYSGIAVGISFLFFLTSLPQISKSEIRTEFFENMAISLFIAFVISSLFALVRLIYTLREIKTGMTFSLSPIMAFAISVAGMTFGLFFSFSVKAKLHH